MAIFRVLFGAGQFAALGAISLAADPSLDHIHQLLLQVRAHRQQTPSEQTMRGAEPSLMEVKHDLRDWIEARLSKFHRDDDLASLVKSLNTELNAADLTCVAPKEPTRCSPDEFVFDGAGYITGVNIEMQQHSVMYSETAPNHEGEAHGVLVVKTNLGVLCGSDESAYVYEWSDNHLQRILDDEQIIASGKPYTPQDIDAVRISSPDEETKSRNILVLGNQGWCASNWHSTYHRIWRTSSNGSPAKLLLSNDEYSFFFNDPPIEGSIGHSEALVEFRIGSHDGGVHSYETIRHYRLKGDEVVRIDPIALGPRSFVEEWAYADWTEAEKWSVRASLPSIRLWHGSLHKNDGLGEFDTTMHCRRHPDLWEVRTASAEQVGAKTPEEGKRTYFTVRWSPPYTFRMVAISDKPSAECDLSDEHADEDRTLFPTQDWVGWK